jgi:3'-5' exonuclease
MSYLIMDIETVPDRTMWSPPDVPIEIARIKLKDGKPPTKGDVEFAEIVIRKALREKLLVHPGDIEKALDVLSKDETERLISDRSSAVVALSAMLPKPEQKDLIAPPQAQRPIVIGALWLGDDYSIRNLGTIDAGKHGYDPATGAFDEKSLITAWSEFMAKERPTIVDWNGRTFDVPVLVLRAFRHGVPMRWYFADKNYRYRYSDDRHLDLMDTLTDYGAVNRAGFKLDVFAKSIGLPGKYGVDGSMVEPMFKEGKLEEIKTYCLTDVIQTGFLLLRYMLMKGTMTLSDYQKNAENLFIHVGNDARFSEFSGLINPEALLLT